MPGTVNQYQQTAFVDPQNGQSGDASVVLSNDNATRGKHNSHDADATIHIQSSDLAGRPAAGTPQRAWWTTDEFRLYFDFGGAWNPLKVRAEDVIAGTLGAGNYTLIGDWTQTGNQAITGNVTASGLITAADLTATDDLVVGDDASIGGDLTVTGLVTAADLTATDDLVVGDDASVGGDLSVTGAITGTAGAAISGGRVQVTRSTYAAGDYFKATNGSADLTLGLVAAGGTAELELTGVGATFTHKITFNIGGSPVTVSPLRLSGNLGVGATYVEIAEHLGGFYRIYIGAADSGGAGYRMLRVLN